MARKKGCHCINIPEHSIPQSPSVKGKACFLKNEGINVLALTFRLHSQDLWGWHFTGLPPSPSHKSREAMKYGKMVKQGFHFDLSYCIPGTEPRSENIFPFLHWCLWSDFSLSDFFYFLHLFFQVIYEFIFSDNVKGLICIEFLDSIPLIKDQCKHNMFLARVLVNVSPWE